MEINEEEFLIIPEWDSMVENDLCKSYMPVNSILGFEGFRVVSLEAGEVLSDCIGNAVHLLFMGLKVRQRWIRTEHPVIWKVWICV